MANVAEEANNPVLTITTNNAAQQPANAHSAEKFTAAFEALHAHLDQMLAHRDNAIYAGNNGPIMAVKNAVTTLQQQRLARVGQNNILAGIHQAFNEVRKQSKKSFANKRLADKERVLAQFEHLLQDAEKKAQQFASDRRAEQQQEEKKEPFLRGIEEHARQTETTKPINKKGTTFSTVAPYGEFRLGSATIIGDDRNFQMKEWNPSAVRDLATLIINSGKRLGIISLNNANEQQANALLKELVKQRMATPIAPPQFDTDRGCLDSIRGSGPLIGLVRGFMRYNKMHNEIYACVALINHTPNTLFPSEPPLTTTEIDAATIYNISISKAKDLKINHKQALKTLIDIHYGGKAKEQAKLFKALTEAPNEMKLSKDDFKVLLARNEEAPFEKALAQLNAPQPEEAPPALQLTRA